MDPLSTSSILSSAERQISDPSWPSTPGDREMTGWSPERESPRLGSALMVYRAALAVLIHLRSRLGHLAPASSG